MNRVIQEAAYIEAQGRMIRWVHKPAVIAIPALAFQEITAILVDLGTMYAMTMPGVLTNSKDEFATHFRSASLCRIYFAYAFVGASFWPRRTCKFALARSKRSPNRDIDLWVMCQ